MKILIKLGGTLLDDAGSRTGIAKQLVELAREHSVVVVHGGGKQVTRFLDERGVSSRFIAGLRVSDEPVIDAVVNVIAGRVNKQLVSAMISCGSAAVGISGIDGLLISATQLDSELGFVGKPSRVNGKLLDLLLGAGYFPVVACIAGDESGNIYNVNADRMAVACALGWRAFKLLFLTDVPGVKNNGGELIPQLTPESIRDLIDSGVVRGGMQAKLEAASTALQDGLAEVMIADGREPAICERLVAGEHVGTRVLREQVRQ
ncbi:MAG: acetylglutamate kinase [Acidobacteriaceae bacterium]|nr:acetylglutamate kinase [Acidobacteriaceae bacterium]